MVTGPVGPVFLPLIIALGLVLLIACANVANLLIARCMARQHEFAVRAAIGANGSRLARQLIVEGAALSVLGCAFGFALAYFGLLAVHKLIPRSQEILLHWDRDHHSRRHRDSHDDAQILFRHYDESNGLCGFRGPFDQDRHYGLTDSATERVVAFRKTETAFLASTQRFSRICNTVVWQRSSFQAEATRRRLSCIISQNAAVFYQ